MLCCFNELSMLSSVKRGETDKGESTATTGDLLLISATTDLSPLSNSNEGDTHSSAKCVSVISPESPTTSGVFRRGGVGCIY